MKKFFQKKTQWISPLSAYKQTREKSSFLFFSGTSSGKHSFIPLDSTPPKEIYAQENSFSKIQKEFSFFQKKYDISSLENWDFPFCGGISSVFSYEYSSQFEKNIWEVSDLKDPIAVLSYSEKLIAFEHEKQECFIAGWFHDEHEFHCFYSEMQNKLQQEKYNREDFDETEEQAIQSQNIKFTENITKEEYLASFENIQKEIEKGNSFQVNLSQGFTAKIKTSTDPFDVFVTATKQNPAPFMVFCEWESDKNKSKKSIISCSPERLFSLDNNQKIWTQPIAGTRKRGKNKQEEKELENELHTSIKEQSEHAMLVDLLRNDFGKISQFGSVAVKDFARIEKYETVMHLVSDIEGILPKDKTAFDVLEAVFPGGTITGAPKRETMKILATTEEELRGFYCGSCGYVAINGVSDFNILIRTLEYIHKNPHGILKGRAGGGIVYNADGEKEYEETLVKWSGMKNIFEK